MRSITFGSDSTPDASSRALLAFSRHGEVLASEDVRRVTDVLEVVRPDLQEAGWKVAEGTRREHGIPLPGPHGLTVAADGWHDEGIGLWVETGRAWTNNAFLVHTVEAAMVAPLHDVVLAVREVYSSSETFGRCAEFLGAVWRSERLNLPFESLLLIGF